MLDNATIQRLLSDPPPTLAAKVAATIGRGLVPAREVADACGISVQGINGWKRDGRVSKDHLRTLATLTGLPVTWWLPGSEPSDMGAAPERTPWPFAALSEKEWTGLGEIQRAQIDGALMLVMAQIRGDGAADQTSVLSGVNRVSVVKDSASALEASNDDHVEVSSYDVKFAAGPGRFSYHQDEREGWAFRMGFLRSINVRPANAMVVYLDGPSHEPVLPSGSALLVDRGVTELHTMENGGNGWLYAFWWDQGLAVKRLVCHEDGAVMAYSYNTDPAYAPFQINKSGAARILGRVKWASTKL